HTTLSLILTRPPPRPTLFPYTTLFRSVNQYAQRILSTPGKHDGLAWKNADGTWEGPVGEEVAKALEEGYKAERGQPYHGYYFKGSEEHTSELQSPYDLVCRLLLEKKKK